MPWCCYFSAALDHCPCVPVWMTVCVKMCLCVCYMYWLLYGIGREKLHFVSLLLNFHLGSVVISFSFLVRNFNFPYIRFFLFPTFCDSLTSQGLVTPLYTWFSDLFLRQIFFSSSYYFCFIFGLVFNYVTVHEYYWFLLVDIIVTLFTWLVLI